MSNKHIKNTGFVVNEAILSPRNYVTCFPICILRGSVIAAWIMFPGKCRNSTFLCFARGSKLKVVRVDGECLH